MNSTIKNIVIFIAGAGSGVAISWKLLKTKYEQISREEIASVKEVYSRKENKIKEVLKDLDDEQENVVDKKEVKNYSKITENLGYVSTQTEKEAKEETKLVEKPYVIPPDEFDELDYDTVTLTYYADKVLVDEYDNRIEDVESLIGEESLTHFGEYEDDAVYVRDDIHEIDYEILLDIGTYAEVTGADDLYPGDDE